MALNLRRLAGILTLVAAIGCPKPVAAPTAVISGGALTGVTVGQVVRLDGSTSSDPQTRELTFSWSFAQLPPGSAATLNDAKSQSPSFVADVDGDFAVQLVVANAFLTSPPAVQKVSVTRCGGRAPINGALTAAPADGQATIAGVGRLMSLTAHVVDPDNSVTDNVCTVSQNQTITYSWKMVAQPASSTAALNNPAAASPSFTPDVDGDYVARLVSTDSTGRSSTPSDLTITISRCGSYAPSVDTLTTVTERAGVGVNMQLFAGVSDRDNTAECGNLGQTLSYLWSMPVLPAGSHAQLNSDVAQNPSFMPDIPGNYTVRLVVTDSTGRKSAPKDLPLTVIPCGNNAPVATLPQNLTGVIGGVVQLSANVTDADASGCNIAQTFHYSWALRALPAGSTAQLNSLTGTSPSFVPDLAGSYHVELVVTDQTGLSSAPAAATVIVQSCGASNPSIDALTAPATQINAGDLVTITAAVSDADNIAPPTGCGLNQTFTFAWVLTSRPKNSNAFIINPAVQNAQFVADIAGGSYQAQLTVTDSTGRKSAPRVVNLSTSACGLASPTISSAPTATPVNPNPGVPVVLAVNGHDADNDAGCGLNQALTYNWSVFSRPATSGAALTNPATRFPGFTPDAIGTYQFSVTVTDSTGNVSAPSFVSFTTTVCGSAVPTVTASANNTSVDPFTVVQLTAVPADADNSCLSGAAQTFTYAWTLLSRPNNSSAVLSNPTSATPTLTPDVFGSYQLQVTTTDSTGLTSQPAFVNVAAKDCGLHAPSIGSPGITFTGGTIGTAVTLTAGAVADDNCLASGNHVYSWTLVARPGGSQALLGAPTTTVGQTNFVPDVAGAYQISLTVSNSQGFASQPVFATINAAACGTAAINFAAAPGDITSSEFFPAGTSTASATRDVGVRVQLTAHYTDPNNNCGSVSLAPFSYRWALVAAPSGSRAALTSTSEANPSFIPDIPGTYQVAATVTDALGNSTPTHIATLQTTSCGANPLIAAIAPAAPQNINSYAPSALTASVSDADNTSCPSRFQVGSFTYQWQISTLPPAGRAVLSSSTGVNTTFEAFSAGAYEVQLVATGSNGLSSAPTRLAFNVAACGSAAPTITSVLTRVGGVNVSRPAVGQVVNLTANATDADTTCGDTITSYAWSVVALPSGSSVATSAASSSPTFTFMPDVAGSYQFSVVATDATGLSSAPVLVAVSTAACGPAIIGIRPTPPGTTTPVIGSAVALQITPSAVNGVADVVDQCVTTPSFAYQWTLLSRPASSQTTLGTATSATSGFVPDVLGSYQVQLVVTDNAGLVSAPATVTVQAGTCETTPPNPQNAPNLSTEIRATPALPNIGDRVAVDLPNIAAPGGSCSSAQTQPYQYRWSLISVPAGSRAQLTSATDASPTFVPDIPDANYQLAATVTDALGNVSRTVFLSVRSTRCGANLPVATLSETAPAVVAASPFATNANFDLSLLASATDADNVVVGANGCPASFAVTFSRTAWTLVSAPVSARAAFTSSSTAATTFRAATPGAYVVQAVVTASNGLSSAPVQATINVANCGSNAPVINQVSASAARPSVGSAVTLTANVVDADATIAVCNPVISTASTTFAWSIVSAPAGSTVNVPAGTTGSTLAITPNVAGTYVFSVIATDAQGLSSAPVTLTVPTGVCGPQIAGGITATSASPNIGDTVALAQAAAITDSCVAGGAAPTVAWSITSRPSGSNAVIANANVSPASFIPDVAGNYTVQLAVTDNGGFSTLYQAGVTAGGCTSVPTITAPPVSALYTSTDPTGVGSLPSGAIYSGDRVQLRMPLFAGGVGLKAGNCNAATSNAFTYQWTLVQKPAGSQSQLSSSADIAPVFVADVAGGTYQFMLVVKDALGNASVPFFQVLPAVSDCGSRKPTSAFTFLPASPNANSNITLTATVPVDPATTAPACPARFDNNASTYGYAWSVVSSPAGGQATLSANSGGTVTLVAKLGGTYAVQLTTTNFDGNSTTSAPVNIAVNACGAQAPVASALAVSQLVAGNTLSANLAVGFAATLSATVVDPDNALGCALSQTVSYSWRLTNVPPGSRASLLNPTTPTPTLVPDVATASYTAQLTVTDNLGYSSSSAPFTFSTGSCGSAAPVFGAPALTAVQSFPGGAPAAITVTSAGGANIDVGYPVQLTASVTDANSAAGCSIPNGFTYQWSLVGLPAGSAAQVFGGTTASPSFTPDVTGSYALQLTVTDGLGHSTTTNAPISLTAACGAAAPVVALTTADATHLAVPVLQMQQDLTGITGAPGSALSIRRSTDVTAAFNLNAAVPFYPGFPVQLSSLVSDPDTAGGCNLPQTISYSWRLAAQPAGSTAVIGNATAASPSFTPDLPGAYSFSLTVTDSTGRSSTSVMSQTSLIAAPANPAFLAGNCGTATPVAHIEVTGPLAATIDAASVNEPVQATTALSGTASVADTVAYPAGCGLSQALTYKWSVLSGPPGATGGNIPNATLAGAGLTFGPSNTAGTYVVALDVSAGKRTGRAQVNVVAADASRSTVAVNAAATAQVREALAIDPTTNNPVVAYFDSSSGNTLLKVKRCTGNCNGPTAQWTAIGNTLDNLGANPFSWAAGEEPRNLDLKVDSGGTTYVAWGTTSTSTVAACAANLASITPAGVLTYAMPIFNTGGGCLTDWSTNQSSGRYLSLALTGDRPAVAYQYNVPSGNYSYVLYNECLSNCASSPTFSGVRVISGGAAGDHLARWVSLKFDAAGVGRVTYYADATAAGATNSLFFSQCAGNCGSAAWSVPRAISTGTNDQGRYSSLAVAAPGALGNPGGSAAPRVAFFDKTLGVLKLAHCESNCEAAGVWSTVIVDSSAGQSGIDASLALDAGGLPRIAYQHSLNGLSVAASSNLAGPFSVLSLGDTGASCSAATTASGALRVGYLSTANSAAVSFLGQ